MEDSVNAKGAFFISNQGAVGRLQLEAANADSSGGSRGEVGHRIGIARSCMNLLEKRIWMSSIRLDTKICLYQTYIVPVLLYGVRHGIPQSSSALALMHLTRGHYARSWGYHILAMWRMWTSEQPPDAVLSPTWSLTDVCGSLDILPAAHHKRTTTVLSLRWSGGCLQIGSDRQEYPATPGFVQWRQTLADRTLALHLPWGRQLSVTTGGTMWIQQCSSGVCYERRRCCYSLQRFDTVGWATKRAHGLWKNWTLVFWWWHFNRSFARHVAPVVTTTSITLSSNKIQNGDVLVPANSGPPGKWSIKRTENQGAVGGADSRPLLPHMNANYVTGSTTTSNFHLQ